MVTVDWYIGRNISCPGPENKEKQFCYTFCYFIISNVQNGTKYLFSTSSSEYIKYHTFELEEENLVVESLTNTTGVCFLLQGLSGRSWRIRLCV